MKRLAAAALLFSAACATTDDDAPFAPAPPPAASVAAAAEARSEQRLAEMQTQLTELLERLDVMSHRITRLEEGVPQQAAVPARGEVAVAQQHQQEPGALAPAVRPQPQPRQMPAPEQPQRALVGAKLADDYRQAIILFGRGRHTDARRGFQEVFESDSTGDLADNALFWIGETYFAAGDYTSAMRYYARVVNDFSDQNKAPDALFKTALAQEKTGDLALARRTLQQVIERFPYSSTASSAKAELQRIRY
ncbi:MAG TPA: tol-pal system protein YbgF [Thermoanaerobaculia bacterium]|nr:tol-pal system protein YbgF [Thermoanaerobaculia bacterium]